MYLRGLGLGIIVAALIMSFGTTVNNKTLSDAEIRSKAKELGMVDDSSTLANAQEVVSEAESKDDIEEEVTDETVEDTEEETVEEATEEVVPEDPEAIESEPKEEKPEAIESKPEEEKSEVIDSKPEEEKPVVSESKPTEEPAKPVKTKSSKSYTLQIQKGYSSDRIAKILEEAGVVDNAASFDKYLGSNGYDRRISTGLFFIPSGSDYAEIAKIITNSK